MFPPNGSTPAPIAAWRRCLREPPTPSWRRWPPGPNRRGGRFETKFGIERRRVSRFASGASSMTIRFHKGDLPAELDLGPIVAIDTETLGLEVKRDRLCVVQLSRGDGSADVVQIGVGQARAPRLERLLADANVLKLFYFGRFDMGTLCNAFGGMPAPVYCTKIAS